MGSKYCPETPRQKMINMMYIVLTAMLALNVAAEVLDAFKIVNVSLLETFKVVDMKNAQVYARFEQAMAENETRVKEWKEKADYVKLHTDNIIAFISTIKEELVTKSGYKTVGPNVPLNQKDFYLATLGGDTLILSRPDDLNVPSEFLITQKKATELKEEIKKFRSELISLIDESDTELIETINSALDISDPPINFREGGESKSWETERFLDNPLAASLTILSKMQIDVKNSEANLINYLFSQIDAGSFLFNKLGAQVIPNSNIILQGDEYIADVFLAAEDTTQQPEILINNKQVPVRDGKATYRVTTSEPGIFSWSGLIKYKTPGGVIKSYPFRQEYQVTQPSVTMSATRMNVFYRGLDNPFDVGAGGIPHENLEVTMTNGRVLQRGDAFIIQPNELDEQGRRTTVTVHAKIGNERRVLGRTNWRVKRVPDPIAKVAGQAGGSIRKERLLAEDGVLAELEDFDFDFKYTVTQFRVEISAAGGYVNFFESNSNRFTEEQKNQFRRLNPNSLIYIANIKAVGTDGVSRDLDPISFKIQ